jgi:calcium-dependent protein kinase
MNVHRGVVYANVEDDDSFDMHDTDERDPDESFEIPRCCFETHSKISDFFIRKDNFVLRKMSGVQDDYEFKDELGEGTFGKVYKGIHKVTGEVRAIKQISRSKITRYDRFINEVNALKMLDHPNIIKLFEIYEEEDNVYLVQEMCNGGELFQRIADAEFLTEKQAAVIFHQILQAILY